MHNFHRTIFINIIHSNTAQSTHQLSTKNDQQHCFHNKTCEQTMIFEQRQVEDERMNTSSLKLGLFQINGQAGTDLTPANKIAEKKKVRIGISEVSRRKCRKIKQQYLRIRESTTETLARVWCGWRKKYIGWTDRMGLGLISNN